MLQNSSLQAQKGKETLKNGYYGTCLATRKPALASRFIAAN